MPGQCARRMFGNAVQSMGDTCSDSVSHTRHRRPPHHGIAVAQRGVMSHIASPVRTVVE